MRDTAFSPLLLTAGLSLSPLLHAQQRTPPAAVTAMPSTAPAEASTTPAAPLTPAQKPPEQAQITWVHDKLTISASNSSLNQILREISHLTGLKITGGVAEERVFGNYGPGTTSQVLSQLLDGASSNMLIVAATANQPAELILTPLTGGPTPPNPNSARYEPPPDAPPPPQRPEYTPPADTSRSTPVPANATPEPITQPSADSNNSTQQSPNGVRTPQQIFEELQRIRQQRQQQQQANPE